MEQISLSTLHIDIMIVHGLQRRFLVGGVDESKDELAALLLWYSSVMVTVWQSTVVKVEEEARVVPSLLQWNIFISNDSPVTQIMIGPNQNWNWFAFKQIK